MLGWNGKLKVTIPSAQVVANVTNFPIFVNLELFPEIFFDVVKSDGGDVRVTLADETTEIPIEVNQIDKINKTGRLYFKGDLSSTVNNEFYVFFANPSATKYADDAPLGRNAVWVNSFNPVAVYHLNNITNSTLVNSVGGGFNGTCYANPSVEYIEGTGYVVDFNGTSQWIGIEGSLIAPESDFSISMHIYPKLTNTSRQQFFALFGSMDGGKMRKLATTGYYEMSDFDGTSRNLIHSTALNNNEWHYFIGTKSFSNTRRRLYIDGSMVANDALVVVPSATSGEQNSIACRSLAMGGTTTTSEFANTKMSELRVYSTEITSDWATVEFNNIQNSLTFALISDVNVNLENPTIQTLNPNTTTTTVQFRGIVGTLGSFPSVKGFFRYRGKSLDSPYQGGSNEYKVSLHTHTTDSDGDLTGTQLMLQYQNEGYLAVAKTDHDTYANAKLDDPGGHSIIHIPGIEYSAGSHLGGVGLTTIQNKGANQRQAQINQAIAEGGLTTVNHPSADGQWAESQILSLNNYDMMEIWNARYPLSEYFYDYALSNGKKIWCTATDDFHTPTLNEQFRGWVVLKSNTAPTTYQEVISILRSGNFYAVGRAQNTHPQPPTLDISCSGLVITVETDKNCLIEFVRQNGQVIHSQSATQLATYTYGETDQYIRIKATYSDGVNQSWAWSNPIYPSATEWITTPYTEINASNTTFTHTLQDQVTGSIGEYQAGILFNGDTDFLYGSMVEYTVQSSGGGGEPGTTIDIPGGSHWVVSIIATDATLQGPPGPQGVTGSQGANGPQGATGSQGTQGGGVPSGGTENALMVKTGSAQNDVTWGSPNFYRIPSQLTIPSTANNESLLYGLNISGRIIPHMIDSNSYNTAIQTAFFGKTMYIFMPNTGTTAPIGMGTNWTVRNSSGAQSHPAKSTTNFLTQMNRALYSTTATANTSSGIQSGATVAVRGNASNIGGFFYFCRFGFESVSGSGQQIIVGLSELNAAITGEPSNQNNTIAIIKDSNDSTLHLLTRNASTPTKTNLNETYSAGNVYDLFIYANPNSNSVTIRLVRLNNNTVIINNQSYIDRLPENTTFMYAHAQIRNTGTAINALAVSRIYVESNV